MSVESRSNFSITNYSDKGQSVTILNTRSDIINEICLKYLFNMGYKKIIFKRIYENGLHIKAEKRVRLANYWEIITYQYINDVILIMWHYNDLKPNVAKDSILYLELVKTIFRRLKKEVPSLLIEQLSKYPKFF